MAIRLSRSYPSRYGAPVVHRADPAMFTLTFFGRCMACTTCHDSCCQYGADIELPRVRALERHRRELEAALGVPRADWFREDPADFGLIRDPDYPGGRYTRTRVVGLPPGRSPLNAQACVFLDPAGRGCRIHRFALDRGFDVHDLKPMVCLLFPLSFADDGLLRPSDEFEEDALACRGPGQTVYEAARPEVEYYFGPDLVAELDRLERQHAARPAGAVPLRVCPA